MQYAWILIVSALAFPPDRVCLVFVIAATVGLRNYSQTGKGKNTYKNTAYNRKLGRVGKAY